MSIIFSPSLLLLHSRLWLMRLKSASLLVLPLSVLVILLTDCLEVGAVVLIVAEVVLSHILCG